MLNDKWLLNTNKPLRFNLRLDSAATTTVERDVVNIVLVDFFNKPLCGEFFDE